MSRPVEHGGTLTQLASIKPRTFLIALIVLRCILSVPLITHAGWLDHEADFYNTARTLIHEGRLPTPADFPGQGGVLLQATQPPLYYVVIVPVIALFDGAEPVPSPSQPPVVCYGWAEANPTALANEKLSDSPYYSAALQSPATTRIILRSLNVLLTCAALALVYAAARLLLPGQRYALLFASALLGFEPNTLYFTTIISNDALLLMLSALYVYTVARVIRRNTPSAFAWLGIGLCAILAILTRLNGWVLLPVIAVVLLVSLRPKRWTALSIRTRRQLVIGGGLLLVSLVALLAVNVVTTGSLFGRYQELDEVLLASAPNLFSAPTVTTVISAVLRETGVNSYLSPVNFIERPRIIAAFGWFSLLVFGAGLLVGLNVMRRVNRRGGLVLAAVIVAACLLVFVRNLPALNLTTDDSATLIYAPLRYYVPGFPALAILVGFGLARWRVLRALGLVLIVSWIGIGVVNNLSRTTQPPPLLSASELAALPSNPPGNPVEAGFPRIVTALLETDAQASLINLRLVTTTEQRLSVNYAPRLEFVTPDGRSTGCQFPLANSQYPTMWWQPGDRVDTQVKIPVCTGDLPAGTRVGLRWIAAGAQSQSVPIGQLPDSVSRAATCPPYLGSIDNSLLIVEYNARLVHPVGELYLPSINWYVQGTVRAYTRAFTLTHVESGTEYTCVGQPRLSSYAFSQWKPGETVYFDECPLQIPADAPPGTYQVSVTASDPAGNWLPAADPTGQPFESGRVEVATIELVEQQRPSP